ncbi:ABC transporter substrate-binding protein [Metabacillus niabensis]|uniref:Raffinose/stachyose/melibiose transport system substrate-binding protein n=1 Tax=Metabacillus niabensis TaxID=324854 RepID=A0ABT9YUZ1_9BACI|nr:ABC transporter substrate-binding protein [Metabacillus niabensis]MDQ0223811.1 raffinose/stachyose/melibiose transport system substrate-binding protein [Metabacillus niabensis]
MKKYFSMFMVVIAFTIVIAGCSNKGASNEASEDGKTTLSLFLTMSNEGEKKAIESLVAKFEEENPDINIDLNLPGGDYEDMLRVKMAANDMPDLFDTHGWSQLRYGEYVADQKEMDWVQYLDPSLNEILKDDSGKVYAFPLNQAKDGITYNANVLEKYGIEVPTTLDEFMTALETVKEKSNGEVTPLWIPGGDKFTIAQIFDELATPLLITDEENSYGKELEDGSFDWSLYTPLAEALVEMQEKGLLNEDVLTAKLQQATELIAQDKIAFTFVAGSLGPDATELNPEVKIGTMPVPAIHEGDTQSWIGGERHTIAIWKDTKHPEEAKKFIEFMAKPENVTIIAEGTSAPDALTNVDAENYFSEYYKKYEAINVQPYFDRVYLPSGMWDVMATTGQELLAGTLTPEQVSKTMGEEYTRLRKQN